MGFTREGSFWLTKMERRSDKIKTMEGLFWPGPEEPLFHVIPAFDDKISAPFGLLKA